MRLPGSYSVEVIATGDEILLGRIADTNSAWMARRATEMGARLRRITCIGDDIAEIAQALEEALARGCDLVVCTGGLGPSDDDLTVEAIARAVGRSVERSPEAVEMIRRRCAEFGVELTPRRERMARLVEGARPLPNPVGMAPGILLEAGSTAIVALPGVPQEMKAIFDGHVAPVVERRAGSRFLARTVIVQMVWRDFFPLYDQLVRDFPDAYLKSAATPPVGAAERERVREAKVDIVVEAASRADCEMKMEALVGEFARRVEAAGGRLSAKGAEGGPS